MLSKNKIKLINSLSVKKYRDEYGLFIAEGTKLVLDLASGLQCISLFATKEWFNSNPSVKADEIEEVSIDELQKISNQKTPQGVLALFKKPEYQFEIGSIGKELNLALDDVQDPGNLGTIIRIADWFGIKNIFCSRNSADVFNSKTVQATMGAIARVRVYQVDLPRFLSESSKQMTVYGTFMDGENIYKENALNTTGIIVMGNEGNGISPEVEKYINKRLLIPNFPEGQVTSESLNVGIATALVCAEFRRRETYPPTP